MVEIGAAAKLEIAAVHLPCLLANAVRIRSRISAAARSVNVTATMRPGSMPRSKSSRYTSTSLRVFPVPALAHTTVLVSNISTAIHPAQPPIFAIDAVLLFGWIRMQFAFMNLADQSFHSHPHIIDNRLVNRVRDDRVFRRTEQQITAIRSDALIGAESLHRQIGINWNLKRLLQEPRR